MKITSKPFNLYVLLSDEAKRHQVWELYGVNVLNLNCHILKENPRFFALVFYNLTLIIKQSIHNLKNAGKREKKVKTIVNII